MKINGINPTGVNPYNHQNNVMKKVSSRKVSDKLEISPEAKVMQQGSSIEAERQAKVEEVKLQVENGVYQLNPKATAKGIIDYYFKN